MTIHSNACSIEDTTPWFRQFWPWFVISIPAATVCACLVTITIAVTTADPLVVQTGRGVDVQTDEFLRAEQRARELGIRADLTIDAVSGAVLLTTSDLPDSGARDALQLKFAHPTMLQRDFEVRLTPTATSNTYTAFLQTRIEGRWYVSLEQAGDWRVTGILGNNETTRLNAESVGR